MLYRDYLKDKYQNAIKITNSEGVPCILEHSKGKDIKNYEIYGNSVQEGTPTPENPIELQSVGDFTTKNLLPYPYSNTTKTVNGVTFTDNVDGSVTVNGTATANATYYFYQDTKNLINGLKIGDIITVSIFYDKTWASSSVMSVVCNYYDAAATMKSGNCILHTSYSYKTITIGDDWAGIGMYIVVLKGQTVDNITLKAQVELGSSATEYEPYHKYNVPITVTGTSSETTHIYLDEPLRKVGDYSDYIDFKNQKVVRNVKKVIFNGSETWYDYSSYYGFRYFTADMKVQRDGYGLCNYYNRVMGVQNTGVRFGANTASMYFVQVYTSDNTMTLDEWKEQLSEWNSNGTPLKVCYILETPTEEDISVPSLKTFKGTNIMSVDTSIQPSNIKSTYIRT